MTTARAVDLAASTSEAVRELNHLTLHRDALRGPTELDQVVAELAIAAGRLPQLLRQLGGWLNAEHDAGRVRSDNAMAPGLIISRSDSELIAAAHVAAQLHTALDTAHQHLSRLGATEPSGPLSAGHEHLAGPDGGPDVR